jgi:hypothetical protein
MLVAAIPWTEMEQCSVLKRIGHCIQLRRAPNKMECTNCILKEPALHKRNWIDVKKTYEMTVRYRFVCCGQGTVLDNFDNVFFIFLFF